MAQKYTAFPSPEAFADILKSLQAPAPMTTLVSPQMEQFWDAQEKLLSESERFTRHWFERRHEAIRTALDAARTATSSERADPAKAMEAMLDWQRHSVERLVEDAREWFDTVSRCADYVTKTEAEAVGETIGEAKELTRKATRSAKSEPI
ncbi:phasin family protein [Ruegeria marina]|uniref:Phasin protein n=1 Tax=Ruegeria marina TaxID=639004 RepID=A0A1G6M1P5_9RHOB|nr:phasin family protein [Ruegeria marina]SDC49277.1 Phasin protein [Ruegeria marina]